MSHHGRHDGHEPAQVRVSQRVSVVLGALVALIGAGTIAGLVWLWPHGTLARPAGLDAVAEDVLPATVVSVQPKTCQGLPDDRSADGTPLATVQCADVAVQLNGGSSAGSVVTVQVTGSIVTGGIGRGDAVQVLHLPADAGLGANAYAWKDFSRAFPMWTLAIAFAVLVVAVARLRGLAAMAGLGAAFAMVLVFMLPALRRDENPALVALVGSVAIMVVILYAAHGISAKTTTALIGTVAGLVVTTALAWWASAAAHLNGQTGADSFSLTQLIGQRAVGALVLSGLILAGLGVLNDVTVTQASAVWELHAAAPDLRPAQLFTSGMRIGRDHLASTVYTIAFAYAAVSLPSLMFLQIYQTPAGQAVTSTAVAQEIVGVLVGGIGLVLSIPLTTAIAAAIVGSGAARPHSQPPASAAAHPDPAAPDAGDEPFVPGRLVRRRLR